MDTIETDQLKALKKHRVAKNEDAEEGEEVPSDD